MKNAGKKTLIILLCMIALCSCSSHDSSNCGDKSSSVQDSMLSDSSYDTLKEYPEREQKQNDIVYYTDEEAISIIQENTSFLVADTFVSNAPKSMSHFSSFTVGYRPRQDNASFYEDFKNTFEYIFPDEIFYDDCFFYCGENSNVQYDEQGNLISTCKTVKESYDKIINGEENVQLFFYTPHFDSDQKSQAENNIFIEFTSPVGSDLSNFNRGVLADYYYTQNGGENDVFLETFGPWFFGKSICTLEPDSGAEYMLTDGNTVKVRDAVEFFEEYVNSIPLAHKSSMDMKVVEVEVIELTGDKYAYQFNTTHALDSILFDSITNGSIMRGGEGYSYFMGHGSMVTSNEVDYLYGMARTLVVYDEQVHTEGISFAEALKTVEDGLSDNVSFKITRAEFVYSPMQVKDPNVPPEENLRETKASWKITLYNTNDSRLYTCYVDAIDGGNFRYYSSEPDENMQQEQ